ncbi:hypothetical protein METHPM2_1040022 [Pseudomonas sp. PM2]
MPSGGARAFCLLLRFSKVSRCQSGTLGGRYLNNGYVRGQTQHLDRLSGRLREQARSHIWIAGRQVDMHWPPGPSREQAPSPQVQRRTRVV